MPKGRLSISDGALTAVIEGYAREAGVRQLEKQLGKIIRKSVMRLLEEPEAKIKVGQKDLAHYLGLAPFRKEQLLAGVGVITGLAWTSLGGATLPIEATRIHTLNRGFKLTGQLGEVMKESAEIAYSYISSHLKQYGGDPTFFDQAFVHLHVPEGATPKDGPSAGVTMASALLSLARNQVPKKGVAMTGELTLTGQVLPIGGVREKVIAARRQKIFELILPEANRGAFLELPDYLKEGVTVHFARRFADVAKVLFD
ncbi:Lon protease [compost metagenome]